MSGLKSKEKGKAGEREVVKLLQPMVDNACEVVGVEKIQLIRNQNQSAIGGHDIDGIPFMAIEVKRAETLKLDEWWKQALAQAGTDKVPILVFRQDYCRWRYCIQVSIPCWDNAGDIKARAEVTAKVFNEWFQRVLIQYLREDKGGN
ncbi:endonuclease [Shewanella phage S0112]|nr:endonuclease [Shewanella phage S0112]